MALFIFPFAAKYHSQLSFEIPLLIIFLHIYVSSAVYEMLLCPVLHLILINTYEVSRAEIVVSILQMRKLRPSEVWKALALHCPWSW